MSTDNVTAGLAVAVVALVPSVFASQLPNLADVRGQADDRGHLAAGITTATATAAVAVAGVAVLTRSPAAAAAGGLAVLGYALLYRHAATVAP